MNDNILTIIKDTEDLFHPDFKFAVWDTDESSEARIEAILDIENIEEYKEYYKSFLEENIGEVFSICDKDDGIDDIEINQELIDLIDSDIETFKDTWNTEVKRFVYEFFKEYLTNCVYYESFILEIEWENLDESLTQLMEKINPSGKWIGVVKNFGWWKKSGYKVFTAITGEELLSNVLPDTENTFTIYTDSESRIGIINRHHDNNDGSERYIIQPFNE